MFFYSFVCDKCGRLTEVFSEEFYFNGESMGGILDGEGIILCEDCVEEWNLARKEPENAELIKNGEAVRAFDDWLHE